MTHTPLDALKYSTAYVEQQIDSALDQVIAQISDLPNSEAIERRLDPVLDELAGIKADLRSQLAPWCNSREEWFTYSDGRPLITRLPVWNTVIENLWNPNPLQEPPAPWTTSVATDVECPAYMSAEVSYETPSKIVVRAGDSVFEAGRGNRETIDQLKAQPQLAGLENQLSIAEWVQRNSSNSDEVVQATVSQLRQYIDEIEADRQSQPKRLFDMIEAARTARKETLEAEPWDTILDAVPTVTRDGELAGILAIPHLVGKSMFGTRMAFDIASAAGDEPAVMEVLNEYFDMVRDPDNLMLVAIDALKTFALHVLPTLLGIAEQRASDWNVRVNLADAARNAWAKRISDFGESDGD